MLIAHLSDAHLCPPGVLYQGVVDANAAFAAALGAIRALRPAPDAVLFTGDLADTAAVAEYLAARALLSGLGLPLLALPGNHDARDAFRACFADHPHLPAAGPLHFAVGHLGPVRVIGLDVTVPDEHHGEADAAACAWLDAALGAEPSRPTVVMMHQPPLVTGIAGIDDYRCRGEDRLAAVLRRHGQVERLLCGHIHRAVQARFGGTLLCTAPSTAAAIALRLAPGDEPASRVEPPAVLLHHWRGAGGLLTHHLPVGDFPGPYGFY